MCPGKGQLPRTFHYYLLESPESTVTPTLQGTCRTAALSAVGIREVSTLLARKWEDCSQPSGEGAYEKYNLREGLEAPEEPPTVD